MQGASPDNQGVVCSSLNSLALCDGLVLVALGGVQRADALGYICIRIAVAEAVG